MGGRGGIGGGPMLPVALRKITKMGGGPMLPAFLPSVGKNSI